MEDNWECAACTFQNTNFEFLTCEMCGNSRVDAKAVQEAADLVSLQQQQQQSADIDPSKLLCGWCGKEGSPVSFNPSDDWFCSDRCGQPLFQVAQWHEVPLGGPDGWAWGYIAAVLGDLKENAERYEVKSLPVEPSLQAMQGERFFCEFLTRRSQSYTFLVTSVLQEFKSRGL